MRPLPPVGPDPQHPTNGQWRRLRQEASEAMRDGRTEHSVTRVKGLAELGTGRMPTFWAATAMYRAGWELRRPEWGRELERRNDFIRACKGGDLAATAAVQPSDGHTAL